MPARSTPADPSAVDPLAAFQAEIAAVEADTQQNGRHDDDGGDQAAPSTPEELEFEDDDGTMYVWDHTLRKYVPKGADIPTASTAAESAGNMHQSVAGCADISTSCTQQTSQTVCQH